MTGAPAPRGDAPSLARARRDKTGSMLARSVALVSVLLVVACKKDADSQPPPETETKPTADAKTDEPAAKEEEESPYLDVANFNKAVEGHHPEVVACYDETVGKSPGAPTGRVKTTVLVDGDGKVKKVTFDDQRSTLKDAALNKCIQGKAAEWRFNISLTGADTPMPYTFDLTSGALLP